MFAKQLMSFQQGQNFLRCLMFLLFVSLSIKCALLFSGEVINISGVRYVEAAQQYAEGNFSAGLSIEKLPFYPMMIAAVHLVVGDWELSAKLISLCAMVGALIPLYMLTQDLFDEKTAFWAGLAFALSPILNGYAVDVIRDPIFLFFVAWAVYFFWRALSVARNHFFVLASFFSVCATLCRIEGVLLYAVFGAMLLILAIKQRTEISRWLKGLVLLASVPAMVGLGLGAGLMMVPEVKLGTFSRLGEPLVYLKNFLSGDFLTMYHHINVHFKAYQNPFYFYSYGSFADTARHYLPFIYLISVVEVVGKNLYPIFVLPLLVGFRGRTTLHRGHWLILLVAGSYFFLGYYFLFTHDFIAKRYLLVPALFLYPWVGRGFGKIWPRIVEGRKPRIAMILFVVVFVILPSSKSLEVFAGAGKGDVYRQAGQWLSTQPQFQNAVIACFDPRIRFYSKKDLRFIKMETGRSVSHDFEKMESVAKKNKAEFVVAQIPRKKQKRKLDFKEFSLVKKFSGNINDVFIYRKKIKTALPGQNI